MAEEMKLLLTEQDVFKKPYEKPVLEVIGDVRSITLASSKPGLGESGTGKLKKTP